MTQSISTSICAKIGVAVLTLALFASPWFLVEPVTAQEMDTPHNSGIVKEVINAPIVADGDVAGAQTDVLVNFNVSFDPNVPGKTLLEGNTIRITLPDEFVNSGEPALANVASSDDCVPANLLCTASVMLSGWPQRPLPPPWYDMSLDGTNTLVITALRDIGNSPGRPGIKQVHMIFKSFTNPEPGFYAIDVEAQTGPGGATESGTGVVEILAEPIPRISVASSLNPGAPNSIYQGAAPGELTPLAYDFLLWDAGKEPFLGVTVEQVGPTLWGLMQGDRLVGIATVQAPAGATGMHLYT